MTDSCSGRSAGNFSAAPPTWVLGLIVEYLARDNDFADRQRLSIQHSDREFAASDESLDHYLAVELTRAINRRGKPVRVPNALRPTVEPCLFGFTITGHASTSATLSGETRAISQSAVGTLAAR